MSTSAISEPSPARRAAALLAGIWIGALLALGGIAAPAVFAAAPRDAAGQVVSQIFAIEARAEMVLAVLLILLLRRQARHASARGRSSVFSADLMLLLAAVFCTVAGHFALLPLMDAARSEAGSLSFAQLHAISAAFYGAKTLLVLVLAWRLAAA